jgi:hypothetical protein
MDPRVKTPLSELVAQHALSLRIGEALGRVAEARAAKPKDEKLARLQRQLTQLLDAVEDVDAPPTPALRAAIDETLGALD